MSGVLHLPVSEEVLAEKFARMIEWTAEAATTLPDGAAAVTVLMDIDVEGGEAEVETISFLAEKGESGVTVCHPGREAFVVDPVAFAEGYRGLG